MLRFQLQRFHSVEQDKKMIVNDDQKRTWKVATVACLSYHFGILLESLRETMENLSR
jgi:hypothetical protein